jgi:hypothetical protein
MRSVAIASSDGPVSARGGRIVTRRLRLDSRVARDTSGPSGDDLDDTPAPSATEEMALRFTRLLAVVGFSGAGATLKEQALRATEHGAQRNVPLGKRRGPPQLTPRLVHSAQVSYDTISSVTSWKK